MIGLWIARFADHGHGKRLTLWHLVESTIENRQVTHCGKQLPTREGTVLAPLNAPPSSVVTCFWCSKHKAIQLPDGGELEVVGEPNA